MSVVGSSEAVRTERGERGVGVGHPDPVLGDRVLGDGVGAAREAEAEGVVLDRVRVER